MRVEDLTLTHQVSCCLDYSSSAAFISLEDGIIILFISILLICLVFFFLLVIYSLLSQNVSISLSVLFILEKKMT